LNGPYSIKINQSFNIFNRSLSFNIASTVFDSNGNIYIAGSGNQLLSQYSKQDVWIKKFDSFGNEITGWNKKYDWGHSDDEYATKITIFGTDVIVAGTGNDLINGASKADTWVKRFDSSGNELFSFVTDDSMTLIKYDGDYWFAYSSVLRKYNDSGVLTVSPNLSGTTIYGPIFTFDSSNNVYVSGYGSNLVTPASSTDWIIKKYNSMGIEQ